MKRFNFRIKFLWLDLMGGTDVKSVNPELFGTKIRSQEDDDVDVYEVKKGLMKVRNK